MELMIKNILENNNIEFYREVSFENLINPKTKNKLRYDFYCPKLNLFIEYDGINYHNNNIIKERDNIKNTFAFNNNINIIRLSGINSVKEFESKYLKNKYKLHRYEEIYSSKAIEKNKKIKIRIIKTKQEIIDKQKFIKLDRLSKLNIERKYKEPIEYNNSVSCDMF